MRRRRTGRPLHDPAWHDPAFSHRRPASGNGPTRAHDDNRCRQGHNQPRAGPATSRGGATKRPVRIQPGASGRRPSHCRHQPQIEISTASACGPRVPSSGTFVRLPAPETLHGSGLAPSGLALAIAAATRVRRRTAACDTILAVYERVGGLESRRPPLARAWWNQCAVKPPSTGNATPMTKLAAGLHSQSTAAATSSARPSRPIGCCFMI